MYDEALTHGLTDERTGKKHDASGVTLKCPSTKNPQRGELIMEVKFISSPFL